MPDEVSTDFASKGGSAAKAAAFSYPPLEGEGIGRLLGVKRTNQSESFGCAATEPSEIRTGVG